MAKRIETAIDQAHAEGANALVVITGPTGVGKSALALRFLHDRPWLARDGHLYCDLRGFSTEGPMDPDEALENLLHSVGLNPRSMPAELSARSAWLRSATAGLRLVLLMDDARSAVQVRALLLGAGRHTIVVTSQIKLTGLRLNGATIVAVPPLEIEEAIDLLRRLSRSGDDEAVQDVDEEAEAKAIRNIAHLCDGLPIALCTLALAKSDERWSTWSRLEKGLRETRTHLSQLNSIGEGVGVEMPLRETFDLSYESLSPEQAHLYRRLSWHPGPEITPLIVSCLTGSEHTQSEEALRALARQHLVVEHAPGRYRFHKFHRLHAQEKATEHETVQEREQSVARLVSAFAELSESADRALRSYVRSRNSEGEQKFSDVAEAARWVNEEKDNLVDLISLAAQHGLLRDTLRMVEGLWTLFLHHGQARLWLRAAAKVIPAARELDDQETLGRLLNKRGLVHSRLGQVEEAIADLEEAQQIWSHRKNWKRVAQTLQRRGILAFEHQNLQEALGFLEEALAADEHTDAHHHRAVTLWMLGRVHLADGTAEEALKMLEQALPLLSGSTHNQALTRIAVGGALVDLGHLDRARCEVGTALAEMVEHESKSGQGQAWEVLGQIHERRGALLEARRAYQRALELLSENEPARHSTQQRLNALD